MKKRLVVFLVSMMTVCSFLVACGQAKTAEDTDTQTEYELSTTNVEEMSKEDLLTLSKSYEQAGDTVNARAALVAMHKLYPDEENLALISAIPVTCDDANAILLCETALMDVDDANIEDIRAIIESDEFASYFKDDIVGVTRVTNLTENGRNIEVSYGDELIELKATDSDGKYREIEIANTYSLLLACRSVDGLYDGDFLCFKYDGTGQEVEKYKGTFSQGHVVGSLQINTEDDVYFGSFDENGDTILPQLSEETAQGHVIYAYNKDMTKYLWK